MLNIIIEIIIQTFLDNFLSPFCVCFFFRLERFRPILYWPYIASFNVRKKCSCACLCFEGEGLNNFLITFYQLLFFFWVS